MRASPSLLSTLPLLVALAAGSSLSCAARRPPAAPAQTAGPKVPDKADVVVQEAVDARVTMLLHLDRLQGYRFSNRLVLLGGWNEAFAGTGIEPFRDVRRTFIAAHASHTGDVAIVLSHTAPEDVVTSALAELQQKWLADHPPPRATPAPPAPSNENEGESPVLRLRDIEARIESLGPTLPDVSRFPFPAAYRYLKNDFAHVDGPVLIAAPHPGLLVVLPPERAFAAFRLMEAGGLPAPAEREAMVLRAWDPESSIQSGPQWSRDVRYAEAVFTFDGMGNSTLKFRAICTSAEAAKAQAKVMTSQVENAQSFSVGGARLRLFDYIEFHAQNERVHMKTQLLADDVDWIVAMSMKPL